MHRRTLVEIVPEKMCNLKIVDEVPAKKWIVPNMSSSNNLSTM